VGLKTRDEPIGVVADLFFLTLRNQCLRALDKYAVVKKENIQLCFQSNIQLLAIQSYTYIYPYFDYC